MADNGGREPLDRDPGWKPELRALVMVLLPGMMLRGARGDGLNALRQIWTSFLVALLLFGVVSSLVLSGLPTASVGPWLAAVAVALVASLLAERLVVPGLDCSGGRAALAASYRAGFFVRIALAESVQLLAFVAAFVTTRAWIYWLVLPVTVIRFAAFAPTPTRLRSEEASLRMQGCGESLVAAIRSSGTSRGSTDVTD